VRNNFLVEEQDGSITSSSTSSEDFNVPMIYSIESFERPPW
jgi:hypothetical protein